MNRFIKYNKFTPTNESHLIKDFTDIVIREIISNYKLLNEFIIDKDIIFVFQFFIIFIIKLKINNKLFIIFYL